MSGRIERADTRARAWCTRRVWCTSMTLLSTKKGDGNRWADRLRVLPSSAHSKRACVTRVTETAATKKVSVAARESRARSTSGAPSSGGTKAKRLLLGCKQSPAIAGLRGRRARRARTLRVSKDTPDGTCDMTAAVASTSRRAHGQRGTAAATVKPVASRPRRLVGRGEKL